MTMPATDLTDRLTQHPLYLAVANSRSSDDEFWKTEDALKPEALAEGETVCKALTTQRKSITEGQLYKNTRYRSNLGLLQAHTMGLSGNLVIMSYEPEMIPLEKKVVKLSEDVEAVIRQKNLEERLDPLLERFATVAEEVAQVYERLQKEVATVDNSPILKDKRCSEKFLKKLQDLLRADASHSAYLERMQKWRGKGYFQPGVSNQKCWEVQGRHRALKRMSIRMGYTTHSLHAIASYLGSIQSHKHDPSFFENLPPKGTSDLPEEDLRGAALREFLESIPEALPVRLEDVFRHIREITGADRPS